MLKAIIGVKSRLAVCCQVYKEGRGIRPPQILADQMGTASRYSAAVDFGTIAEKGQTRRLEVLVHLQRHRTNAAVTDAGHDNPNMGIFGGTKSSITPAGWN